MVRGVRVKVCGVAWGAVHGCMVATVVFSGAMSIELSAACNHGISSRTNCRTSMGQFVGPEVRMQLHLSCIVAPTFSLQCPSELQGTRMDAVGPCMLCSSVYIDASCGRGGHVLQAVGCIRPNCVCAAPRVATMALHMASLLAGGLLAARRGGATALTSTRGSRSPQRAGAASRATTSSRGSRSP